MDLLIEILAETAFWLQTRGIVQWQWPPPPDLRDKMADKIQQGQVYLARAASNQYAIGTLRFEWQDTTLWHDGVGEAGYVHSLAVRPHLHGHKVGETLLEWAKGHVRSHNRKCLRLDCVASNFALRRYYEKLGFRFCGEATYEDFTAALYELEL
jgi:ribosomal protein S18 acetylase RimI-like enzyme